VANEDAGLSSGILNTVSQVGAAVGLAVLATISTTQTAHALIRGASAHQALNKGFSDAVLLASGFAVAALVIVVLILSNRAFVEMVKAGGAKVEDVADSVAGSEGLAAFGGEELESKLPPSEIGVGTRLNHER
jgi:hypothetical protein